MAPRQRFSTCSTCHQRIKTREQGTRVCVEKFHLRYKSARYSYIYDYHRDCMPNFGDVLGEPIHQSSVAGSK